MNPTLLIVLLGSWSHVHGCDLLGLNLCTWKFAYNVTDNTSEGVSAIPPKAEALQMCRYKHQLESCFEPKLEGCSTNIVYLSTIAPTEGTLKFMCAGDLEAYISQDSCWSLPEIRNLTAECYLQYISDIQEILTSPDMLLGPKHTLIDNFCSVMGRSRHCMHDAIKQKCSEAPVNIVSELMETVFRKMTSLFSCQYNKNLVSKGRKRMYQLY
ncbi:uncharacterized protein [Argopecten irradians]|uniref:uncharacterized protein n=1 Tax=Argopecten irradians TaxID=31199 RepID=UPI003721B5F8